MQLLTEEISDGHQQQQGCDDADHWNRKRNRHNNGGLLHSELNYRRSENDLEKKNKVDIMVALHKIVVISFRTIFDDFRSLDRATRVQYGSKSTEICKFSTENQ